MAQWVSASAVRSQYGLPQPPERLLFATDSGTCHRVGGNLRLGIVLDDSLFMFIYSSTAAHGPCRVRRVNWIGNFANTDRVNRGDKRPAVCTCQWLSWCPEFSIYRRTGYKNPPPPKDDIAIAKSPRCPTYSRSHQTRKRISPRTFLPKC